MEVGCVFDLGDYDLDGPSRVSAGEVPLVVDFLGGEDAFLFRGAGEAVCCFSGLWGLPGWLEVD